MSFEKEYQEQQAQQGEEYGEQEFQQQSGSGQYYQPVIMSSEKADLYDKIRPEDVVETIKYLLMGYVYDKKRMEWYYDKRYGNIALSEIGAGQISTLLLPVSNKNVSISKLKDDEIRSRVRAILRTSMNMCLRNWYEYGIRSPEQFFFVKEIIVSIAFITLKQPEDAGVRTFIQGVTQEHRMVNEQPKKEGVMGAIFRR